MLRKAGSIIGGWVPGHVDASLTLAELNVHRAADAVRNTYSGNLVDAATMAEQLDVTTPTANRWLQKAAALGLVRSTNTGWEPA